MIVFMTVLYRKYRPQSFGEIVGQRHIVSVLKAALSQNRVSHAYLFSGPRGTGKTTVARIFARAVNCLALRSLGEGGLPPCNQCEICSEFLSGKTLDLIEIDAASSRGIDEIRSLREGVNILPFKSKYKVYIIDEVHMLTAEAFNALLKTLEEPPAHVIFILATTEIDKIPETIISRAQHFEFRLIGEEELQSALAHIVAAEGLKAEAQALGLIATLAEGSLRDAQSILDQALVYASSGVIKRDDVAEIFGIPSRELLEKLTLAFLEKDAPTALKFIHKASAANKDMKAFFKLLIRNFRFLMYLKLDLHYERELQKFLAPDELAFIKIARDKFELKEFESILNQLHASYALLKVSYLPQLPLELAALKITS
ncbi:MAG: DNA polymerase III subunit gamma/tau [bacterium]|nr:DNA polymerase III subunit gamma/tau [bacterium]